MAFCLLQSYCTVNATSSFCLESSWDYDLHLGHIFVQFVDLEEAVVAMYGILSSMLCMTDWGKYVGVLPLQADTALLEEHYGDLSAKPFFKGLVKFMASGPVCAMVDQFLESFCDVVFYCESALYCRFGRDLVLLRLAVRCLERQTQ